MRYRHVWPGVLLLTSLALLLGGLVLWGDHFLSPGPSGGIRRLLELWAGPRDQDAVATASDAQGGRAALADGAAGGAEEDRADVARETAADHPDDTALLPTSEPGARAVGAELSPPRYSLELGTFAVVEEAERAEAQLNQAGFSTVRFRQREPARLFTVTVALPVEAAGTQGLVDRLRQEGFLEAMIVHGRRGPAIRIAREIPLRSALELSERLRSAGHDPRVRAEAPRVGHLTLRHGTFSSREEAEAAARVIARLGVSPEVVQVR